MKLALLMTVYLSTGVQQSVIETGLTRQQCFDAMEAYVERDTHMSEGAISCEPDVGQPWETMAKNGIIQD